MNIQALLENFISNSPEEEATRKELLSLWNLYGEQMPKNQRNRCERLQEKQNETDDIYASLSQRLLPWFRKNARDLPWRKDREPYHVWLSEIMLQQTRVEAVKAYYLRFLEALPTIRALADAPEEQVLKLWEGLGYYSRARHLKKTAQIISLQYNGKFPQEYEALLKLTGIGEYTAGAIASICFEQPQPAVDGNVLRVVSRVLENTRPMERTEALKSVRLPLQKVYPIGHCGEFTQALMELGATVCLPGGIPKCSVCPLIGICRAGKNETACALPIRMPKQKRKVEAKSIFVLECEGEIAILKRMETGLLAGLWQLPEKSGSIEVASALQVVADWGLHPIAVEKVLHRNHIFTHIEWNMTCFYISCREKNQNFVWATPDQLQGQYALPTAFRKFLTG